jgi:hypothetical protein
VGGGMSPASLTTCDSRCLGRRSDESLSATLSVVAAPFERDRE